MTFIDLETARESIRQRDHKRCRICGNVKPLTEFHADASRADGHEYRCTACSQITRGGTERRRAPGGGRKPLPPGEVMHGHTIRLTDDQWEYCQQQGDAAAYIRTLIHNAKIDEAVSRIP